MKSKANAVAKVCCISIVSIKNDCSFIPHEFACLNHSVLSAAHNYAPPTGHTHYTLRQQPQPQSSSGMKFSIKIVVDMYC